MADGQPLGYHGQVGARLGQQGFHRHPDDALEGVLGEIGRVVDIAQLAAQEPDQPAMVIPVDGVEGDE